MVEKYIHTISCGLFDFWISCCFNTTWWTFDFSFLSCEMWNPDFMIVFEYLFCVTYNSFTLSTFFGQDNWLGFTIATLWLLFQNTIKGFLEFQDGRKPFNPSISFISEDSFCACTVIQIFQLDFSLCLWHLSVFAVVGLNLK